jgi:uncharacterized membrane protein
MLPYLLWFHLIGVVLWVGASMLMPLVYSPAVLAIDPASRLKYMEALSKRLSPILFAAVIVVLLTGIEQTRRIYGFAYLLGVNTLTIKIFIFVLMWANGIYSGNVLTRKVIELAPAPGQPPSEQFLRKQRSLAMHSWIQFGLSVIVLLLVGFLTA